MCPAAAGEVGTPELGDELVQPDAGRFGVLLVRYGQPPGYLTLAGLARYRATPACGGNNF
jgi:hypothetical protein